MIEIFFMYQAIVLLLNICCIALLYALFTTQQASSSYPSPVGEGRYSIANPNFKSSISALVHYSALVCHYHFYRKIFIIGIREPPLGGQGGFFFA